MEYLDNNLKYLKKKNNIVYDKIKTRAVEYASLINNKFSILCTKDGYKTIEVECCESERMCLNSIYSPKREAERWVKKFEKIGKVTSLIMFGFGNGFFFNELELKTDSHADIYIYEPDLDLFVFILYNFDLKNILSDKRTHFFVKDINDKDLYIELSGKTNWTMLPTQLVCCHPVYDRLYKEEYQKFLYIIEEYRYAMKMSKNTSVACAKKFTLNTIRNLEFVKNSNYLGDFFGKIDKKIPVIIVAAGPSLDKNIDELKNAEGKSIILATDSAVKTLMEHNINFDAIVTIDGNKYIEKFEGNYCENISIFTIPDAKYELLKQNKGRKIWISGQNFYEEIYKKYGYDFPEYLAGGSVATAAFSIAKILGMQTIILIGQDLAYSGEITHSGQRIIEEKHIEQKEIYIDGIYGEKVKTKQDWLRYLQWFENIIAQMDRNINVIDATEGGAKIRGTKIMKLTDAIDDYCKSKFEFKKFIADLPVTFSKEEYNSFIQDVSHFVKELDIVYNEALLGKNAATRIMFVLKNRLIADEHYISDFKIINVAKDIILRQQIYLLLDEYISADVAERIEIAAKTDFDKDEKEYENIKSIKVLFDALLNSVNDLKPVVESIVKRM